MQIHQYALALLIIIAFYKDITEWRIPNRLSIAALCGGLFISGIEHGWNGIWHSILGMFIGFALMLTLHWIGAVGAGDVKLFAAIGAISGTEFVLYSLMYSIVYAGVIGLFILIFKRRFFSQIASWYRYLCRLFIFRDVPTLISIKNEDNLRFPFMLAVLPAVITTFVYLFP